MELQEFKIFLEKYKAFRELSEQYKSTKFCKLYYKMYEYTLSIPKEKIVISHIKRCYCISEYMGCLFSYIYKFIEAKDFYNWKNRIYSLLTEKIGKIDYKRYKLYYNSKAKEFYKNTSNKIGIKSKTTWNSKTKEEKEQIQENKKSTFLKIYGYDNPMKSKEIQEKSKATLKKNFDVENPMQSKKIQEKAKNTCMKNLGVEHPAQSKEVQDKMKATNLELYGKEYPMQSKEIQEKSKNTCLEIYGVKCSLQSEKVQEKTKITLKKKYNADHPMRSKEIQEKHKNTCMKNLGVDIPCKSKKIQEKVSNTWKNKTKEEIENIIDKRENTCLAKYGREHVGGWFNLSPYSNFGNEVCTAIDNLLGNPEDSIYYAKSGKEYCIHTNTKNYYVDMVIPSLGLAFEADGVYYHGLIEGQEYVYNTPVKEIWEKDKEKSEVIEKAGYKVFHIRDDEYYKDPETCINNLLEQIREYFQ